VPINLWAADTGDAPASFGTASHDVVTNAPQIGEQAPDDNEATFSAAADADDADLSGDDEDGVFGFPLLVQNAKAYSTNVFVSNPSDDEAFLRGWVDFDRNGVFDADESAYATVPTDANNAKIKLRWNTLTGVSSDALGITYARFRISSIEIDEFAAVGNLPDGEVEDYTLNIEADFDGDEVPDSADLDNDNDGIPDAVEGGTNDADNDGIANAFDFDSDNDSIPDFIEAGSNPVSPIDSDADGIADFLDIDSNNDGVLDGAASAADADGDGISDAAEGGIDSDADGILNALDLDSDNDIIPDVIEFGPGPLPADTDGDGIADFLDLDSDNDGITDINESNFFTIPVFTLDANNDGRVDSGSPVGANGFADAVETEPESGIPTFAIADSDGDGVRDYLDADSDADGVPDAVEAGGVDADGDGVVDDGIDRDGDGLFDGPINLLASTGSLPDANGDFIPDFQDPEAPIGGVSDDDIEGVSDDDVEGASDDDVEGASDDDVEGASDDDTEGGESNEALVQTGLQGVAGCSLGGQRGDGGLVFLLMAALLLPMYRRLDVKVS